MLLIYPLSDFGISSTVTGFFGLLKATESINSSKNNWLWITGRGYFSLKFVDRTSEEEPSCTAVCWCGLKLNLLHKPL